MKSLSAFLLPLAAVVGAALLLCSPAHSEEVTWVDTMYTASLTFQQVEPKPTLSFTIDPNRFGTALCLFNRNPVWHMSLDCEVQHDVRTPTNMSIRRGQRGEASGPPLYSFSDPLNENNRQVFYLQDIGNYTVQRQEQDFLNGLWHILVESSDLENGEIRGQLEHQDTFFARLRRASIYPLPAHTAGSGLLTAVYSGWNPNYYVTIDVSHNVYNPYQADIRRAQAGQNGQKVASLHGDLTMPIIEEIQITQRESVDLFKELFYFAVIGEQEPDGEIRGNLYQIEPYPKIGFAARLTPQGQSTAHLSSNSRSSGCALFAYHCDTKRLEYMIIHDVLTPLEGFVFAGLSSDDSSSESIKKWRLPRVQSPIFGSRQLLNNEEWLLYNRNLYISIFSATHPTNNGEISGQIGLEHQWVSYLSGRGNTPPVTTASVGCATMNLDANSMRVQSLVLHHDVADPLQVELRGGLPGQNGREISVLGRGAMAESPVQVDSVVLDDDDYLSVAEEESYLIVTSLLHPETGEIRGPVYQVAPCNLKDN